MLWFSFHTVNVPNRAHSLFTAHPLFLQTFSHRFTEIFVPLASSLLTIPKHTSISSVLTRILYCVTNKKYYFFVHSTWKSFFVTFSNNAQCKKLVLCACAPIGPFMVSMLSLLTKMHVSILLIFKRKSFHSLQMFNVKLNCSLGTNTIREESENELVVTCKCQIWLTD